MVICSPLLGFVDAITGGSFSQMSVFALNITPYINEHQRHARQYGLPQCFAAAVQTSRSIVIADDRHDAGLHGPQRDKEKCLPLIVKAQRRNGLI